MQLTPTPRTSAGCAHVSSRALLSLSEVSLRRRRHHHSRHHHGPTHTPPLRSRRLSLPFSLGCVLAVVAQCPSGSAALQRGGSRLTSRGQNGRYSINRRGGAALTSLAIEDSGAIDPTDLAEFVAIHSYSAEEAFSDKTANQGYSPENLHRMGWLKLKGTLLQSSFIIKQVRPRDPRDVPASRLRRAAALPLRRRDAA